MGNRPTRFSNRYYSNKQEKSIVKAIGGRQTPNSGATRFVKGDVLLDEWLIEAKTLTAERQNFTIKKEWLSKMQEEAFAMGKSKSALAFNFGDEENYYVINEKLFKCFLQLLEKEDREFWESIDPAHRMDDDLK